MKVRFQYVTDVEGDLPFFKKQIRQSDILRFSDQDERHLEFQRDDPNEIFVFGGDVCDRGEDIGLTEMLVALKRSYPDRVILIVGNRDANKTRFSTELPLDPREKLDDDIAAVVVPAGVAKSYQEYLGAGANTPINRLKWILECTMGAPAAFECRRKELASLRKEIQVSDEDVYLSFRVSVEPGGFMRNYLTLAQIGAVVGDTLIVHGGVNANNVGKVPDDFLAFEKGAADCPMLSYPEVSEWIRNLNCWYRKAIDRWVKSETQQKSYQYSNEVPASPLQHIAIGPGSYFKGQLPVVGSFLKEGITPWPITEDVAAFLQKSGINRVVAGHQPNSGMPLMLLGAASSPINDLSVQVFTCDTLYGNRNAYDPESGPRVRATDPRGSSCAVVHVLWNQQSKTSCTSIKGVDGFGVAYDRTINYPRLEDEDPYIGRVLKIDDQYYTVRINFSGKDDSPYVLTNTAKNYSISYRYSTAEELAQFEEKNQFLTETHFSNSKSLTF